MSDHDPCTLAGAIVAIGYGVTGLQAVQSDRCVSTEDVYKVDNEIDALWSVGKLLDLLADLLDGVMADDPQAIRDAAAWLTANRPEVNG